jgi:glycosyltransferase involved in cell wall biosynthesis
VTTVHIVVPDGIDDPSRPSGGNVYDRRVCGGLAASGWTVHEHRTANHPAAAVADVLAGVLDGGLVLVDGLVASAASEVIVPRARRLRLVVLLHMPLGVGSEPARPRERAVLSAVASVVTTSRWARQWLLDSYALPPSRVRVVEPGAEIAALAPGSPSGGELLCVGAVTPTKGHDVLVAALAAVSELEWRCVCVGALDLEPGFVDDVRRRAERSGIGDRLRFTGPLTGPDLDAAYAGADVLLSASRAETYGMVVTEALAHGLPVVAGRVGGLPEALGRADDGERPGLLVPPEDPHALAAALRRWLVDPEQRERLRKAAQARRLALPDWSRTSRLLSRVLDEVLRVA